MQRSVGCWLRHRPHFVGDEASDNRIAKQRASMYAVHAATILLSLLASLSQWWRCKLPLSYRHSVSA